jgi:NAD(P)-dependent dehydrogenase (short-subunit alcohol dehydrogenase family)
VDRAIFRGVPWLRLSTKKHQSDLKRTLTLAGYPSDNEPLGNARPLADKVAIVTGAGGTNGIGRCYARTLGNAGASVVIVDINEDGALAVAKELAGEGIPTLGLRADVSDAASVADVVDKTCRALGGVDILVNNAALMAELTQQPITEYSIEEWNRILAVNVTGVLICSQAVVSSMRERGGGKIVNQSSAAGFPPGSPYGISKLAVAGLTIALARQLGKDRICVNAIAPGIVDTDSGFLLAPEGSPMRQRAQERAALPSAFGRPEDLSGALLLLTTPAGDWITGQTISVDGGWVFRT